MKVNLFFCPSYIFWPIVEGMDIKMRLLHTRRQGVSVQLNDPAFWPLYHELVESLSLRDIELILPLRHIVIS